jgi:hypothetical protein
MMYAVLLPSAVSARQGKVSHSTGGFARETIEQRVDGFVPCEGAEQQFICGLDATAPGQPYVRERSDWTEKGSSTSVPR